MPDAATGPNGGPPLQLAYFVTVLIVMAVLGVAVAREVGGERGATEAADTVGPVADTAPFRAPEVRELVCFTCHGLTSYREGGDGAFSHEFHFDMVGVSECHYCHAFDVHEPIINRQDCEMCHE